MTRTVTAHQFCSINGVTQDPHLFQFDCFGATEGELMGRALAGVTDVVIGRKLFEEWSAYWQAAEVSDPFAEFINPVRKHVISSTLHGDPGWNGTVAAGDPVEYVQKLRETEGGGIVVAGGIETIRTLFLGGVIDTLTLTIHPAIGVGQRLFDDSVDLTRLRLVEAQATDAGNVVASYALRG
ncbi:dihydrofolate reductase family protein [Nocardioides limicola]|uniref:dihydrofolate reductase family protein n=1 Tax=Nocardioides limicola TaxID=2803368 RepID=UPI00193B3777|nr:dihydrofolate reductase family protein [Nocardioides sp. DJM-14]